MPINARQRELRGAGNAESSTASLHAQLGTLAPLALRLQGLMADLGLRIGTHWRVPAYSRPIC